MKELLLICILLGLVVIIACKTTKDKTPDTNTTITDNNSASSDTLVVLNKGGCFGRCPIYTMTIFNNGKATYEGKRFSNRLGMHVKQLDRNEFNVLKKALRGANLDQYPDKYETRIPDLPSTTITYHGGAKQKSIFFKDKVDDPVKDLAHSIEAMAKDETGWVLDPKQELPDYFIANEFIVQLKEEIDAEAFVKAYRAYNLEVKDRVTPRGNYWTMTYDTNKIQPYEMLNKIAADKQVIGAEFNKQTKMRGR